MRILQVSSEHPPQQVFGLGRYVCDLSRELAKQGHEVHVLTNSIGGKEQDIEDQGVHLHRVDFPPPPKPPGSMAPVLAFNLHLQQKAHALGRRGLGDPEVVVSHDWLTVLAGERLARRFGAPHVWTVHDIIHGKRGGKLDRPNDQAIAELEHWGSRSADAVLGNSRAILKEIQDVYGRPMETTGLLHCGIAPERFESSQETARIEAFRKVLAPLDHVLVTYTGRLDPEKGIDTLVNAFARFHARYPRSRLAIVGRGLLEETIRNHASQLKIEDAVTLYGYLKGEVLKHIYIASDIHVCPSLYEPFGLVAAEAMAAGTPVVVSATGGLTDIVSSPNVGRTFQTGDVDDLAVILHELACDRRLRRKLGKAGARHVCANFAWSKIAKVAVELYAGAQRAN